MTEHDEIARAAAREYADLSGLRVRADTHRRYSEFVYDLDRTVLDALALNGSEVVVDVGCGTGSLLRRLAADGHTGRLLGVDPSAEAVTAAVAGGAWAVRGSADALPLAGACLDVVLARHMLYHVPDPAAAIAEFHRVLRPGGRLLVTVNHAESSPRMRALIAEEIARAGIPAPSAHLSEVHSDNVDRLLGASFPDVRSRRIDNALVFPASEPLIAFAHSYVAFLGPADPSARDPIAQAVAARIRAWFAADAGPWRDPKGVTISVATREV
jgi:SAM-dependent methyltransferase